MALPFAASADFAFDKEAGEPCRNLRPDLRCGIHDSLRTKGFAGCTVYECFGAGQQLSQVTYSGRDWRQHPASAPQMFALLPVMRQLHEMLFLLEAALDLCPSDALRLQLRAAHERTTDMVAQPPEALLALDIGGHRSGLGPLLLQTSKLVRARTVRSAIGRTDFVHADLMGAKCGGADLRGADFRGALLIGADLRRADLRLADLLGADLRAADLREADLSTSIFLTQLQLNAARGNSKTRVPPSFARPDHWVDD